ncbi:MAG: cobalamin biosynthesis protein P47K [Planctomycetales bacterium]|nr:cobalamin biosynthesis protein P47K [Planctomycetales bacterium]
MRRIRFLMVGGFLGAGKTTTIGKVAAQLVAQGLKVGLVTNDQAHELVDTYALRSQGFAVGEVPGACFCCKFDDLIDTAAALTEAEAPDVVIAEPVGSCTDLVATVIEPLRHLHGDEYEVGPLAVLLKPEHGRKILGEGERVGFSPKAAYIFLKQIEEADVVVINKVDKLTDDEIAQLRGLVAQRFPGKQVLALSARRGDGLDELLAALAETRTAGGPMMEVDYDVYAEGEAELGWLNCACLFTSPGGERFPLDDLALHLVSALKEACDEADLEVGHVKVYSDGGGLPAIANLVGADAPAELSVASEVEVPRAEVILNARVATSPEQLQAIVARVVAEVAQTHRLAEEIRGVQCFRPGRPIPTHRAGQNL